MEHSRQCSLWVLGPQPTAGSTGATAPSLTLPTRDVAIMEGELQEDQTVSTEDLVAEDVIFAHLNHRSFYERLFTPAPLSPMHPSAESSIYEELVLFKFVFQLQMLRTIRKGIKCNFLPAKATPEVTETTPQLLSHYGEDGSHFSKLFHHRGLTKAERAPDEAPGSNQRLTKAQCGSWLDTEAAKDEPAGVDLALETTFAMTASLRVPVTLMIWNNSAPHPFPLDPSYVFLQGPWGGTKDISQSADRDEQGDAGIGAGGFQVCTSTHSLTLLGHWNGLRKGC
ncbi:KIR3DL2 [Cervus elaphus hippelaphus]|uniref:KIR3DL2 n=1 Tax=Cervus elaphus hippelaphus TaxID=46360 RepID=A0A212C142_CEREH|nr:KIR3DL2 [Cervus elaphus hippelaphus]